MAHRSRDLPWSFLTTNDKAAATIIPQGSTAPPQPSPQRKSFAQALTNVCDVPISKLPKPCLKGEKISIKIPEEAYQAGLDRCKNNLHGRLMMSKGDKPLRVTELREKLVKAWAPVERWQVTPLGKGFYEFYFQSREDLNRVWSTGTWNLKPGLLRLSAWTSDFKPEELKITHAQVWVRLYSLPQEYWMPTTLFAIASGVGTPLSLDTATQQRTFGHYARILVDIDLAEELHYQILVEREGFAFFADVDYGNLPHFCDHCCCVGHSIAQCRKVNTRPNEQKQPVPKPAKKTMTMFVPKAPNPALHQEKQSNLDHVSLHTESDQDDDVIPETALPSPVTQQHEPVIEPVIDNTTTTQPVIIIASAPARLNKAVPNMGDAAGLSSSWADDSENSHDEGEEAPFTVVKSRRGRGKNKTYTINPDLQTRSRMGKLHHTS
ncbi:hypothetical protein QL285_052656 [Trifolium repens]|nr:hypothetical protein QL285_052656 [Trifolium repens]